MTAADDLQRGRLPSGAVRAFALALLLVLAPAAVLAKPAGCRMLKIAEWTVRFVGNLPVIDGAVDGNPVGILLDTGATYSLLTHAAAERFGLNTWPMADRMAGVGGLTAVHGARVDLTLGGEVTRGVTVRVAGERRLPGIDFVLGDDFFRQFDLEFDYARDVVRLFRAEGCRGAHLAYWDRDALGTDLERAHLAVVTLRVNGRPARAMLDSGASFSVVSTRLAEALGLEPGDARLQPAGCATGVGAALVTVWAAPFESIQVGDALIRNARLRVADFLGDFLAAEREAPDVLLGSDFLRSHRVLLSRSQSRLYFSHAGGTVFPPPAVENCRRVER